MHRDHARASILPAVSATPHHATPPRQTALTPRCTVRCCAAAAAAAATLFHSVTLCGQVVGGAGRSVTLLAVNRDGMAQTELCVKKRGGINPELARS